MPNDIVIENQCSLEKIDSIFAPIIEEAISIYRTIFGASVINIRLLGSVARGEAIPYQSEIDFVAILAQDTPSQIEVIETWENRLRRKYPVVAKVDLEVERVNNLVEFRRFVFASDSLSLFGSGLYPQQVQRMDRHQLAELVTPNLPEIIESYQSSVEHIDSSNQSSLSFYSRIIGKDILKCFRYAMLMRGGAYERNVTKIYNQLLDYTPERQELLHDLHELYIHPVIDKKKLLDVLNDVRRESEWYRVQ